MRTDEVDPTSPTHVVYKFLTELPSTIRKEIWVQLFGFFEHDYFLVKEEPIEDALEFIVSPSDEIERFYRAILIVAALEFIFTREYGVAQIFYVRGEIPDILAIRPSDPPRIDIRARIRDYNFAQKEWGKLLPSLELVNFHAFEKKLLEKYGKKEPS